MHQILSAQIRKSNAECNMLFIGEKLFTAYTIEQKDSCILQHVFDT